MKIAQKRTEWGFLGIVFYYIRLVAYLPYGLFCYLKQGMEGARKNEYERTGEC